MAQAEIPTINEILRGSAYALTIFRPEAVAAIEVFLKRSKPYLKCVATGKDRPAKPEEIVRQLYLMKLMQEYGYPAERISLEKPVYTPFSGGGSPQMKGPCHGR